jgi:Ran GTPase-activating protein (RanGAP) involved in mRNA processing and transport
MSNNLNADVSLGPLVLAARELSNLLELNLSMNIIGPVAAQALFDYLVSPNCTLQRLILNGADVDDFECGRFVEAINQNRSLQELHLSRNLIGSAENLNTVMPDVVTGGEALADLLRDKDCHLKTLILDWNMIRLGGAVDLAQSVSINISLVHLDLSFNSLSTEGGIVLGTSILKNKTLLTLILECNQLDVLACFTICAGIIENRGLRRVVLDGNPIGEQGAKALMLIPLLAGNRVKVSAARCNVTIRDSRCWFDFDKLIRDYRLDMNNGFERAVSIILLHLIAGHHS